MVYGETGRNMSGGESAANLKVSADALTQFVKTVDGVLKDLEGSAGNPTRVGDQTIRHTSLRSGSAGFHEADALYGTFNQVHQALTNLSKTLHLQIEAIGIAVQGANGTFNDLEEEQRRRFYEIQAEIRHLNPQGDKNTGGGEKGGI
ncbi:hypothetical protein BIV23_04930 [Streptomyces monashensis]|uniref:Uncharacterized protein n=2 Tax=Streptomyces monashensis TaxID=1678012 RepID=A0A1S2QKZ3_9ACTN|nr:hypothetical protein [Streptomyces monashensis]OIK06840.1 hypothetical protein BIV23_04930 [Streptomyces monashensis]